MLWIIISSATWLLNIYKDGVAREANANILYKSPSLVNADDTEWKVNQLVADSKEKLRQLMKSLDECVEKEFDID